jgi:hypothetical protein
VLGRINRDVMLFHWDYNINFDWAYFVALHTIERCTTRRVHINLFAVSYNAKRSINDVPVRIQTHRGGKEQFSIP